MGGKRRMLLCYESGWSETTSDWGAGVERIVDGCDYERHYWDEIQAVERACERLRSPEFRKTVRVVYRVMVLERGSKKEKRKLIMSMLGIRNAFAYYKRVGRITEILTRPRRR